MNQKGNQTTSGPAIARLLERIIDGATSNSMPSSELLRYCMRLGSQLGNNELTAWANAEITGYQDMQLPTYRVLDAHVLGNFAGLYGAEYNRTQIPESFVDKKHRPRLFKVHLHQSIGELENLGTTGDSDQLMVPWTGDEIAYYQRKELYKNFILTSAWRQISKHEFVGILDIVRTRVLDFALKIQEELGIDTGLGSTPQTLALPQGERVHQIFYTTITGGNAAVGSSGSISQTLTEVKVGDKDSLLAYLRNLGIEEEYLSELSTALQKDNTHKADVPNGEIGKESAGWLGKVSLGLAKGTVAVATNGAGSLIAAALAKYWGLS